MSSYEVKIFNEASEKIKYSSYVLGIDVGGTNTRFGIAEVKQTTPHLLYSLDYKTSDLPSFIPAICEVIEYSQEKYDITFDTAGIGVAGVVSPFHDYAHLTNAKLQIDRKDILHHTSLTKLILLNDFQTIGYGINCLDSKNPQDFITIRQKHDLNNYQTKAILGAGTGLGKTLLLYDTLKSIYIPQASEGGHADFPIYNSFERDLSNYIQQRRHITQPVSYEELLSGRGIEAIHSYLIQNHPEYNSPYVNEIQNSSDKAASISAFRTKDTLCQKTFQFFTQFFARCAKNFVLDTLALGGLYLGGGIVLKNPDIFQSSQFIEEFENAHHRQEILKQIPIYLIVNDKISLYGACLAAINIQTENR